MGLNALKNLEQFLDDYPGMSISPSLDSSVRLHGNFRFIANVDGNDEVEDSYKLEIIIPDQFPSSIPTVRETGGKIPREADHHVNQDGSLCLGSPLRLLKKIYSTPDLSGFTDKCLIPYLYAVSYKLKNGGAFVLGELGHGTTGLIDDYSAIFDLKERCQVEQAVALLGLKKRKANKRPCPCGCGKRLGVCPFRFKINEFRKMAPASWFRRNALPLSRGG